MSEEKTQDSPSKADHRPEVTKEDLRDMFAKFMKDSEADRINNQLEFSALKSAVDRLSENSSPSSTVDHLDTPPDRRTITRRTSYLFGVPSTSKFYVAPRPLRDRSTLPQPVRETLSPPASLETPPFVFLLLKQLLPSSGERPDGICAPLKKILPKTVQFRGLLRGWCLGEKHR